MTPETPDRFEVLRSLDERLRRLLTACAKRDKLAFTHLYESTSTKLFGILLHILKRHDLAQECLQEVYLKIWNNAGDYKPHVSAPLTWMTSIARYQALDLLRRQRRELIEAETGSISEQVDQVASPEEQVTANSYENMLDHCLCQLKSDQRQVFVLAYYKGLTHSELAQHTAMPVGTIKTWIRRGMKEVKRCMTA
jgi:RNA polymerase sigma-70 factor (ECF subfamily)